MFKNLKIAKKLIISFILIAVIASVSGIVNTVITQVINAQYSYALTNYGFSQGDIGQLLSAFGRLDGNVHDAISYSNDKNAEDARGNVQKYEKTVTEYFEAVSKTLTTTEEKALYDTAKSAWDRYMTKANELVTAGITTDLTIITGVQERLVEELDPIYLDLYNAMSSLMDRNVTIGNELSTNLDVFAITALIIAISLIVAAIIISIILGVLIARGIANPMKACAQRLTILADGDLKAPVPDIRTRDEIGQLSTATNRIVSSLNSIIEDESHLLGEMGNGNFDISSRDTNLYVGDFEPLLNSIRDIRSRLSEALAQINQSADQVASGSDQVSSGAQALSQGATEQASSVQQLAATINEISGQVQSNAQNAQEASDMAQSVGREMEESNRQMQNMISAMSEISEGSNQISKIIKTIEDIAFQTNILALNAAVEAARAGAAGKGFAVVADEVRNLASKSAEASSNTAVLIESSISSVENGTKIADATAKALLKAVEGADQVVSIVEKISGASVEQANSLAQVTQGVDQISNVVQTNSATSEQSAAASEELSGQAQILKSLVGKFRLPKNSETVDSDAYATTDPYFGEYTIQEPSRDRSGKYD